MTALPAAPVSISAPRVVTPLYPAGVVANPTGLTAVVADPHGNLAGLAARAALVADRNFKAGEMQYRRFVVRAYNPRTGDVYIQHETGSAVHRVNRVTGACDCEDATKGQTKRLRMACQEAGLNPDDLPEETILTVCGPPALYCKHFWILGEILRLVHAQFDQPVVELCKFPSELPRKYWALCPSKKAAREYR